jgi:Protein of unknown function (DUF2934)
MQHRNEHMPWRPKMDHEPEFNPFVNPADRTGALENPPPLEQIQAERNESREDAPIAHSDINTALIPGDSSRERVQRHTLIAQAAYLLAERRGFRPGGEIADWLAAEAEIERRYEPMGL